MLTPSAVKNIGIEGRLVRDGVRKALAHRRSVIEDLVKAIGEYRKSAAIIKRSMPSTRRLSNRQVRLIRYLLRQGPT